jgi:predicted kinase
VSLLLRHPSWPLSATLDDEMTFALAVVGAAGSGKSTVALEVARRSGATYLDKDSVAGPLVEAAMRAQGQPPEGRESNRFYRESVMPAEYAAILSVAADNLRLGLSVVIDAPFAAYLDQPEFFDQATRRAGWPEVTRFVLQVFASEVETRRRLEERGLPRDRAKLSNWDEYWPRWGRSKITWTGVRVLHLDTESAADIDEVLALLRLPPCQPASPDDC